MVKSNSKGSSLESCKKWIKASAVMLSMVLCARSSAKTRTWPSFWISTIESLSNLAIYPYKHSESTGSELIEFCTVHWRDSSWHVKWLISLRKDQKSTKISLSQICSRLFGLMPLSFAKSAKKPTHLLASRFFSRKSSRWARWQNQLLNLLSLCANFCPHQPSLNSRPFLMRTTSRRGWKS